MVTHANIYTLHVPCVKTKWTNKKGLAKFLYFLDTLLSPRMLSYLWLEHKKLKPSFKKKLIVVSGYLERNILASYPKTKPYLSTSQPGINIGNSLNKERHKVVRYGFRKEHTIPKDAYVLLFIAHDFKRKGIHTIIKALEILNNDDIYLIVAGKDNPKKVTFGSNIVQTNTLFLGPVANMDDIYPGADTLIHPTLNDTYGMVVVESMIHQLSVIVSNKEYCGVSEYINKDEAVILDDPRDAINLSKSIDFLHTNIEHRDSIAKNGFKKAKTYTWEHTLAQTLKAYQESIDA
jgi:UDP-glucose:(heptosyl)LPS alpha-1,3-glucosyltransferase